MSKFPSQIRSKEDWHERKYFELRGGDRNMELASIENCDDDMVDELVRRWNLHDELVEALQRASKAGGPFDDSHSPYWAINADDMAAIRVALSKAKKAV